MTRNGKTIALYGPDGSGKTTIAEIITELCKESGINVKRYHWRPGIIPYTRNRHQKDFMQPHSSKGRAGIKGCLILILIYVDFLIGHLVAIAPAKRKGSLIIYERYFLDVLIDQKRYGLNVSIWIRKVFAKYLPKNHLNVILDAPASILIERKAELEEAEIEAQRKRLKLHLQNYGDSIIVDVEKNDSDEVASEILQYIL